jgi:hypothetical protein
MTNDDELSGEGTVRAAGLGGLQPPRRRSGRRRRSWPLVVAIVAGAGLLLGACGGDGDGGEDQASSGDAGDGAQRQASDPEAVRSEVDDLLANYDRVVNQIIADPGVAADREDPLVQEYLTLFEPGSDFAEEVLDAWVANGEEGVSVRPFDDQHPANRTRLDGEIEVEPADEARVPFCVEQRQNTYRGDQLVQGLPLLERQGEIVAVRVDGEWLLQRRDVFGDRSGCRGEGEEEGS